MIGYLDSVIRLRKAVIYFYLLAFILLRTQVRILAVLLCSSGKIGVVKEGEN